MAVPNVVQRCFGRFSPLDPDFSGEAAAGSPHSPLKFLVRESSQQHLLLRLSFIRFADTGAIIIIVVVLVVIVTVVLHL